MFNDMTKIYEPDMFISYVIYYNEKSKKMLYSACGNLEAVVEYCKKNKIDYSKCKGDKVGYCYYLRTNRCLNTGSLNKR